MKKIEIELILPQGALFYQNINLFIYKQYINFLYKLNCFVVDQKCCSCPLSKECYYYHCTGENFKYYPNILIENPIFTQAIFQKEEVLKISFFIIGEDIKHMNYINLFFQSYLNQKIQGYFSTLPERARSGRCPRYDRRNQTAGRQPHCCTVESRTQTGIPAGSGTPCAIFWRIQN